NAELSEVLGRLDRAGIRDLFVVGGDASEPAGKFADGLSLLQAMAEIGHRLTRIGVPSYPEGHHAIDDEALWSALRAKQRYAGYTVTQLCFDADVVCSFAAAARRRGITLPIVAGVPGVVDAGRLLRVGVRIGIGDSVRFVRGHRFPAVKSAAGSLLRPGGYRPGPLVRKLGMHLHDGRCDLAGLHIYTFNQVGATVRWLHNAHRRAAA
ncbi:MAG: methylenetetrahydrofolate reductase, partial [Stackebrandtia sp.]